MYQRVLGVRSGTWRGLSLPCRDRRIADYVRTLPVLQTGSLLRQSIRTLTYQTYACAFPTKGSDPTNYNVISENPNVAASKIIYSPISAGQVRTITLHRGDSSDPLWCSLNEVSLEDSPRYQALSYVWGSKEDPATVILNGQPFQVTKNLDEALKQLRSPTVDHTLWVDALCINQENIPERNAQVQQMRMIYANADRVVLWLGPEAQDSDLVMTMLRVAQEYNFDRRFMTTLVQSELFLFFPLMELLFGRAYWFRVWVVQEIAYAKDVLLVCGSHQISYASVVKFIDTILVVET